MLPGIRYYDLNQRLRVRDDDEDDSEDSYACSESLHTD